MVAHVVKAKDSIDLIKRIIEFIDGFNYSKKLVKSDKGDIIKKVRDEIVTRKKKTNCVRQFSVILSSNIRSCWERRPRFYESDEEI